MQPHGLRCLTIDKVEAGTLWNVIPGSATLEGTTRYFTRQLYNDFPKMMEGIVQHTAETYRCKADLNYIRMIPPTINDVSFV